MLLSGEPPRPRVAKDHINERRCQVGGVRTNLPAPLLMPHGQSGSPSDPGDITPGLKGTITGGSMFGSGQEVSTELEVVVDLAVA